MYQRIESYQGGMPNLSLLGLSENWLLKECGHQHWLALSELLGYASPEFRDKQGSPAYAAFVALDLSKACLGLVKENDRFEIRTQIAMTGKARFTSIQEVVLKGGVIGCMTLMSTLVKRQQKGNNQSVTRAQLIEVECTLELSPDIAQKAAEIHDQARKLRSTSPCLPELWSKRLEFPVSNLSGSPGSFRAVVPVMPCPNSDFNGAGFLYFANFQQLVDRVEWQALLGSESESSEISHFWSTSHRQIFYRGNVNVGDRVLIQEMALMHKDDSLSHWQRLFRESDNKPIADVLSYKSSIEANHVSTCNIVDSKTYHPIKRSLFL